MPLRPATPDDAQALARIMAETIVHAPHYDDATNADDEYQRLHPRIAGYIDNTYHPACALPERTITVATHNDAPIGFGAAHASTRRACNAEIQWMFVLPAHQNVGHGAAILNEIAHWLIHANRTRVIIDVPPQSPARNFYLRHGAVPLDQHWLHWPDISSTLPNNP